MASYPSEITLMKAINDCMVFSPIAIYWNNECIWDDDVDVSVWVPVARALDDFKVKNHYWDSYRVTSINISTTDYHHTIVHICGYNNAGV